MGISSVAKPSMNPDTCLKKIHIPISYHKFRELFAANIITIIFIPSTDNLADLFTKTLSVIHHKELFRSGIFH